MEAPITEASKIPAIYDDLTEVIDQPVIVDGKEYNITCISMGNPHGVVFVDSVADIDIEKIGRDSSNVPDRVNTEFIEVVDENTKDVCMGERCRRNSCLRNRSLCKCLCIYLNKKTGKKVLVHLLGGDLQIEYDEEKDTIFMQDQQQQYLMVRSILQELTIKSRKTEELLEIEHDFKKIIRTLRIYPCTGK